MTTALADDAAGVGGGDPAEAAETREGVRAIAALADEFREALVAVDVVGSYREAARALGVPKAR